MEDESAVKGSRKGRMKKRPDDWRALKEEIAKELGLWEQVREQGWSALTAADSGRLGGVFSARRRQMAAEAEALAAANRPGAAPALAEAAADLSAADQRPAAPAE